ncbi:MAG: hotdog fold thioesterase [Candidatus Rokubacteria bacterium]|nr:hotdog fold thioesterase [Candidatus Rokubacteria bacterium]
MSDATPPPIPADVAARVSADPWARALGIEYLTVARGYCKVALTLAPHMVNFQGRPHGGVIFTLADVAFGAACNSHGEPAVALNLTISYLAAAEAGTRLVAEGREVRQGRRAGFYDVTVSTEDGRVVAFVHCVAHRVAT